MVGHQSAAGQHHHQKCAAAIDRRNSCRSSAKPMWHMIVSCHWTHILLTLCRSGHYQLQQLHPIALSLSTDADATCTSTPLCLGDWTIVMHYCMTCL